MLKSILDTNSSMKTRHRRGRSGCRSGRTRHRRTRHRSAHRRGGAVTESKLSDIINSSTGKPTIINPESKFVIVTYWWGRGNLNSNTGLPCPDIRRAILRENDMLGASRQEQLEFLRKVVPASDWKEAITFEQMIADWEESCRSAGCNYMAIEYPEFALPGGYQLAINAKPLFIRRALELCGGRGVVYIDGDMTVNRYPSIFDMPGIDFSARAWEMDPRSAPSSKPLRRMNSADFQRALERKRRQYREELLDEYPANNSRIGAMMDAITGLVRLVEDNNITGAELATLGTRKFANKYKYFKRIALIALESVRQESLNGSPCFDPYVFQTSGGIMFFADTAPAKWLLDTWAKSSALPIHAGKADDRIISLVMQQYHGFLRVNFVPLPIEYLWLTGRYRRYLQKGFNYELSDIVFEHPACLTTEEMATEQGAASDRDPVHYERLVSEDVDCERYSGMFYEYMYFRNEAWGETFVPWMKYISEMGEDRVEFVDRSLKFGGAQETYDKNMGAAINIHARIPVPVPTPVKGPVQVATISDAIAHLMAGNTVVFGSGSVAGVTTYPHAEFIATNIGTDRDAPPELDPEYYPIIDTTQPIICRPGNPILIDMLALCRTVSDITTVYRSSFIFLHRIRTQWV
jgi:hypothetical protein